MTITLTDLHALERQAPGTIDTLTRMVQAVAPVLDRLSWWLLTTSAREVRATGLEGRYYVRGGLHPTHATEAGIVALAAAILNGTADPTCETAPVDIRRRCAAAALRGWGDHRSPDTPVLLAWQRLIGDHALSVGHAS